MALHRHTITNRVHSHYIGKQSSKSIKRVFYTCFKGLLYMFIYSPDDTSEATVKQMAECGERIIRKNIHLLPLLLMVRINQIMEILLLTTFLYSPGDM